MVFIDLSSLYIFSQPLQGLAEAALSLNRGISSRTLTEWDNPFVRKEFKHQGSVKTFDLKEPLRLSEFDSEVEREYY